MNQTIKKLLPDSVKPFLRKARTKLAIRREDADQIRRMSSRRPCLTDVAISDGHALTFLIEASSPLTSVSARVDDGTGPAEVPLTELERFHRNARHYLLLKMTSATPLAPGTRIDLYADGRAVATSTVKVQATRDASYPLIDRLLLVKDHEGLVIEEGSRRAIDSPTLRSVEASEEDHRLTFILDTPVTRVELIERTSGRTVSFIPAPGNEVRISAEEVAQLIDLSESAVPTPPSAEDRIEELPSFLVRIRVHTAGAEGQSIVHGDPWVSRPRNLQTFKVVDMLIDQARVVARPYWAVNGSLALKLTIGRP